MPSQYLEKTIFEFADKKYNYQDLLMAIRAAGIRAGDTIFIHSDLGHFGKIGDIRNRTEFADVFVDAFLDVIGSGGTIIVPTFTYSFCKSEIFNPQTTPSTVGIFSESLRRRADASRSTDAIFSVSAIGSEKKYFTDVGTNCFGKNSVFEKLHQENAKLVFLGETFDITYMHYVEQAYAVPYRFIKEFPGKLQVGNTNEDMTFFYNVRPLDQNIEYDLEGIASYLENCNVLQQAPLGFSKIRVVTAVDAYNSFFNGFKKNIKFLLKK